MEQSRGLVTLMAIEDVLSTAPSKEVMRSMRAPVPGFVKESSGDSSPSRCDEIKETASASNPTALSLSPFWIRAAACEFKPEIKDSNDIVVVIVC